MSWTSEFALFACVEISDTRSTVVLDVVERSAVEGSAATGREPLSPRRILARAILLRDYKLQRSSRDKTLS